MNRGQYLLEACFLIALAFCHHVQSPEFRSMKPFARYACAIALSLATASIAHAQCPDGAWVNSPSLPWSYTMPPYSPAEQINALFSWDPDGGGPRDPVLVVAGGFFQFSTAPGDVQPRNIAFWDGTSFHPLGQGLNRMQGYSERDSYVWDLASFRGDLIGAGEFSRADGLPANNIARWDGTAWHPLGQGLNGAVSVLTVYNDQLYAAGGFSTAGGTPIAYIASWDGITWHSLATGVDGPIYTMCLFQGKLIVGGAFTHAGGVPANHLASWNGAAWQQFAGGVQGIVHSLAVFQNELVAGEDARFYDLDTENLTNIIVWDGALWHGLGTGTSDAPLRLTPLGTDLFATGDFDSAGGVFANHVAHWDATFPYDWEPVEAGAGSSWVTGACIHNHEFVVGGDSNFSRWVAPTAPPQISGQPTPQTVNSGAIAMLHVEVSASSAVTYQWRREGIDLVESAHTSGTRQSTLVLSAVLAADAGHYSCRVSTACGNLTSASPLLTVTPVCGSADFNHDGDIATDADIEAFFACIAGNCCTTCDSADFNADGDFATDADIEAFFRVLAGQPC
jgi:hypothetical protein